MSMFQLGNFTLNSGRKSRVKFECDAWTSDDVECLAFMISKLVGPFGSVEGVPRGGDLLARAIYPLRSQGYRHPHLIVDDVLTTGNSIRKLLRERWVNSGKEGPVDNPTGFVGAVVFARGPLPTWVKALLPLPAELWDV